MGPKKAQGVEPLGLRSPSWTRTNNLPVNSRLLCQLSYRGLLKQLDYFSKHLTPLMSSGTPGARSVSRSRVNDATKLTRASERAHVVRDARREQRPRHLWRVGRVHGARPCWGPATADDRQATVPGRSRRCPRRRYHRLARRRAERRSRRCRRGRRSRAPRLGFIRRQLVCSDQMSGCRSQCRGDDSDIGLGQYRVEPVRADGRDRAGERHGAARHHRDARVEG